ncbi:hypothetical protein N8979_00530 [bacterium]|nr:hypothetical protein [bacterium]
MQPHIDTVRLVLLVTAWAAALLTVMFGQILAGLTLGGVFCFGLFTVLTVPRLRRDSILILAVLLGVTALLLPGIPDGDVVLAAGEYVLIFAALLPTMALVKATAMTMPSVHKSQANLAALPTAASAGGFQLTAHFFGGIINTGSFAILSAVLPPDSPLADRRAGAEAAIRGMVTSAAWSPFFVGFAVGQSFVEPHYAWMAIGIGVVTATLFSALSLPTINREFTLRQLRLALLCLRPVASRLAFVFAVVIILALVFKLTALAAVVSAMPWLVLLQMIRQRGKITQIMRETRAALTNIADDLIIISAAMMVAFLVSNYNNINEMVQVLYPDMLPGWVALIATPMVMTLASVFGVHPVISSTALLTIFSGGGADVHPALLVQAHLIGWGAGTMSSVASLSVISCAGLYNVPSAKLVFGQNMITAFAYAFGGGLFLTGLNSLIW